jgi:hypothetical protein
MRKLVILAGLLFAAASVPAPATADVGCQCMKFGTPSVCTGTVLKCNSKVGGVCVAPCTYTPQKAAAKKPAAKKMAVRKRAAPKKKNAM